MTKQDVKTQFDGAASNFGAALKKAGAAVQRLGDILRVQTTPDDQLSYEDREWKRNMRYNAEVERQRRIGQSYVRGLVRKLEREVGIR